MKFSIITPEHDPGNIPFLLELFDCVLNQTYKDWEWILYLNNKIQVEHIPDQIKNHAQVIIFRTHDTDTNIGAIKKAAFGIGTGDVLVEVDHDDLITPDCLEELKKAYESDPEVGFVYSDNAVLQMEGEFIPYGEDGGWTW